MALLAHLDRPHPWRSTTIGAGSLFATHRLRRPLAADHNKIAIRREPIEIPGAAELAEPRRQGEAWLRVAAGTENPHTERGAESTDIAPDSAGAHDARSLAFQ